MDFHEEIIIKEEIVEFKEDSNDNYLEINFDIKVKVENDEICEDWCLENLLPTEDGDTICYDNLKKESLNTCLICCQFFTDSYSLIKHNLTHLKVPLRRKIYFICDTCSNYYENKHDLQKHMEIHMKPESSKRMCNICSKTFTYKGLWGHMKEVHGKLRIKCDKCNLVFKCERYLHKHLRNIHTDKKIAWRCNKLKVLDNPIQCPECDKLFWNKNTLKTHIRNCHSDKQQCHICKSVLKSASYLKAHMRRVHYDDGKVHACIICDKIFKSPRYVRVHMKNSHSSKARVAKAMKS